MSSVEQFHTNHYLLLISIRLSGFGFFAHYLSSHVRSRAQSTLLSSCQKSRVLALLLLFTLILAQINSSALFHYNHFVWMIVCTIWFIHVIPSVYATIGFISFFEFHPSTSKQRIGKTSASIISIDWHSTPVVASHIIVINIDSKIIATSLCRDHCLLIRSHKTAFLHVISKPCWFIQNASISTSLDEYKRLNPFCASIAL